MIVGEDIPLPKTAENEDVMMADMDSESVRLGAETDRAMREQNKGATFESYMQVDSNLKQVKENDSDGEQDDANADADAHGDGDGDDDSDFEEGLIAVGLASAKKPTSGKVQEEQSERFWLNALGQLVRIDIENPEEPTACNSITKSKTKKKGPIDPNGRFVGRHLVNWHRMSRSL
jgi:hypothetical protein